MNVTGRPHHQLRPVVARLLMVHCLPLDFSTAAHWSLSKQMCDAGVDVIRKVVIRARAPPRASTCSAPRQSSRVLRLTVCRRRISVERRAVHENLPRRVRWNTQSFSGKGGREVWP